VLAAAALACVVLAGPGCATSLAAPGPERSVAGAGAFPGPATTGVPVGRWSLPYLGPCTITDDGTVIDGRDVHCDLVVRADRVIISSSRVQGRVLLDTDVPGSDRWSYTLVDSEVDAGVVQLPAVSYGNMTVIRSNVHGGATSVQCGEHARSCVVRDSWLHGQRIPDDADWHLGGFLSNGGTNVELTHNSIVCDARPSAVDGGCTGDINLLGDFAPVSHVTIQGNLLGANTGSSYCTYGGDARSKPFPRADHIVYRDNVFERGTNKQCGAYGPVTGFNPTGPGNEWTNNRWDQGGLVRPEN
jgi:hypothetical protein